MQALSPSALQPAVSLLEKTPQILEIFLRDVPAETADWKPAPERWSIREVVAHLLEIEVLYGERAKRIVVEENPSLLPYKPSTEKGVSGKSLGPHLEKFVSLRRAHVFFWHGVPSNAATRTGQHAELGAITLAQLLNELANHDLGHLRQISELYRARMFYPHAGPFQKYSNPKP